MRYAGEVRPRSAVCRNQEGSFEDRDLAIWSRDIVSSVLFAGSGVDRGERAAFSVAITDSGRVRTRSDACDLGRCCHDSVGVRDGIAFDGEFFVGERSKLESILAWLGSLGPTFSFVGEPIKRAIASSTAASRGSGFVYGCIVGVSD